MLERGDGEIEKEYRELKRALSGFVHNQSLDAEFNRLKDLEKQLFVEGKIFDEPKALLGMKVTIRQDDERPELFNYFQGEVLGIRQDDNGKLDLVILSENNRMIPCSFGITHIAPTGQ